jgi:hypothetical protein
LVAVFVVYVAARIVLPHPTKAVALPLAAWLVGSIATLTARPSARWQRPLLAKALAFAALSGVCAGLAAIIYVTQL